MTTQATVLFLSHGGGPMPLLGDAGHTEMVRCLQDIAESLPKPKAIVLFSAHWETETPHVTVSPNPSLIYDYYGFPASAYDISYPSLGEPELAKKIVEAFATRNMDVLPDAERGFDHGMFVPLKIMYPEADIPVVQVSLLKSLNSAAHIAMGKALQSVDLSDVLVIGSGFSFHNMRAFFTPETQETRTLNTAFEDWLADTLSDSQLPEEQREQLMVQWTQAPGARYCHPREEHLLPLHVCYGLVQRPITQHYPLRILGKQASMMLWR